MMPRRRMPSTTGLDPELDADGAGLVGVLQAEVVVDERPRVGEEGVGLVAAERELDELLVVLELAPSSGPARRAAAAGVRAPGGWCQNSPSSAACTRVPLTAWGDGGSGRCSIWEKRKASGQLVKAATFDGLRVRGRSSAMRVRIRRGGRRAGTSSRAGRKDAMSLGALARRRG